MSTPEPVADDRAPVVALTKDERQTLWEVFHRFRTFAHTEAAVERIFAQRAAADPRIEAIRALADDWERDRDTCLAWIADPDKHVDPDHPRRLSDKADWLNRSATALRAALGDQS